MRLSIVAVGRMKESPEAMLVGDYQGRLAAAPAALGPLVITEIDDRKGRVDWASALDTLKRHDHRLVALDETGEIMSSRAFAERLCRWRDDGVRECQFVIGGADGLDGAVRDRAHLVLSLGRMTFPHLLARALLAEQLYRAASLAAGHPYHRG